MGQSIYYDELMLRCEEKNLGRVLPSIRFFSNKASTFTHSNSNYSTNITYSDKHIQITMAIFMLRQQHPQIMVALIAHDL